MSTLTIESTRFGTLQIEPNGVIAFPDGLIGLAGSRYALIVRDPASPFRWLQSLDDPAVALPVCNPHRFFGDYQVEIPDEQGERMGLDGARTVDVYVTVCAAERAADFTANLKAPILVWDGHAHQVINQTPGCSLRAPLFDSQGLWLEVERENQAAAAAPPGELPGVPD